LLDLRGKARLKSVRCRTKVFNIAQTEYRAGR
jgi:hypothetical protein